MARTAQEVYSLFGLKSPAEIQKERQAEYAQMLEGQSGAARAGAGIGAMLGGLFRGEDPEAKRYKDFQDITKGQNLNDPEQLRAMAAGLENVSGFGEQALAMRMLADTIEKESMGETVNVPEIVGYNTEPDVDPVSGLQRTDDKGRPKFIRAPIFRNVPYQRGPEGLQRLQGLPDYGVNQAQDNTPVPDAQAKQEPDFITNDQGVVVRNPAKTQAQTQQPTAQPQQTQQPTAQQPFVPQQGRIINDPEEIARLERSLLDPGATPVPSIAQPLPRGEITYADPEALQEASDALRDQITQLEKSNDKNKEAKIKRLKKRRMELQKQRIASRRRGAPKDLRATGSGVLSGFRDVK